MVDARPPAISLLMYAPQICLSAGKPPREVRLFAAGVNRTLKGDFIWSPRSVALVRKQWEALGRDFGFDYEHSTFDDAVPPQDREAAGWGKLEARPDGLYVVGIQWTAAAAQKIASRAFRYLSPTPRFDEETREIVGVINCALTNLPATLAPAPLVLSARRHLPGSTITTTETLSMEEKHTALAKGLMMACSAMLSAAQAAASSDHSGLAELGATLASALPEQIAQIKGAFPEMGDEDPAAPNEALSAAVLSAAVLSAAKQVTGCQDLDALPGALLALSAKATQKTTQAEGGEQKQKAELVERLIKVTGQVHPQDRGKFLALSMASLQLYAKSAPRIGPAQGGEVEGAVNLSETPAVADDKEAAQDADAMFSRAKRS